MNERLRWWVLPGAIVVLLRVVTLGDSGHDAPPPGAPVEASASGGTVAVLEASGRRSPPQTLPLTTATAFVVGVPERHRGQRGEMTLWRRIDGQREAGAWLTLRPRVKADGTIPIAGLGGADPLKLLFRWRTHHAGDSPRPMKRFTAAFRLWSFEKIAYSEVMPPSAALLYLYPEYSHEILHKTICDRSAWHAFPRIRGGKRFGRHRFQRPTRAPWRPPD